MKQEVAWSNKSDTDAAVSELASQIRDKSSSVNLVMFFASSCYDFPKMSEAIYKLFPDSEVVGCTTSGEIGPGGFAKNTVVLTTMSDSSARVKGILIPDGNKYPITLKDDIVSAMKTCGIKPGGNHDDSFAITFVNGLCNVEEIMGSLLYSIIDDDDFKVLGGSAGDDLKFVETGVSLNGKVVNNGGAFIFVKTPKKFTIVKENIFKPTGRRFHITDSDNMTRQLIALDGKPAVTEYAKTVGVPESEIGNVSLSNPIGRLFGNDIYIASIASVNNDKTFTMYCRTVPGTKVDIMEVGDVKSIMNDTVAKITESVPNPGFVFFINCILRTLRFDGNDEGRYLTDLYSRSFGKFAGYSSYGEQIDRISSNQTLVVLAMEE